MRGLLIRLIIVFVFAFMAACATFSKAREENLREVQPGLTHEQVVQILGQPDQKSMDGNVEKWSYQIISSDSRRYYPYVGNFQDGVLKDFYLNASHEVKGASAPVKGQPSGHRHNNGP